MTKEMYPWLSNGGGSCLAAGRGAMRGGPFVLGVVGGRGWGAVQHVSFPGNVLLLTSWLQRQNLR